MRDFIVIGAGSAGSVLASELVRRQAGSVLLLEAGGGDRHPFVSVPFGLIRLMGSKTWDWNFKTVPQKHAGNRQLNVHRGKLVGGSGGINSMCWFRGRADDFNAWDIDGWRYDQIDHVFDAVEAKLQPKRMETAHPLTEGLGSIFDGAKLSPEYESAGVMDHNMPQRKRRSAAHAYLRDNPHVELRTGVQIDRLIWEGDRAAGVVLLDGTEVRAAKGVVLSAGSVASPAILMRSGIGPADHLNALDIDTRIDAREVGENLHDHPSVPFHFEAPGSGYGLEYAQWPAWAAAPLQYMMGRRGRFTSSTVEGGAFFNATTPGAAPDVQCHFLPFYMPASGSMYQRGSGYIADITLCRPTSRGTFRLASKDPKAAPLIDFNMFSNNQDLATMVEGANRLRTLLQDADFGPRRAPEVTPGADVESEDLAEYIRQRSGTAYHPVGTLRMGNGDAPVNTRLGVKGVRGLWVADASVMPSVTSANTNAPSMMIGWKGAEYIAEDIA